MATPAYLKAFRDFLRMRIDPASDPSGVLAIQQEFYGGSDRGTAILQASALETILEDALSRVMRPLSSDDKGRIFDGQGPLSTFSAKILLGYVLGVYGPKFRHDLDLIRELRNGFAHVRHALTFDIPQISAVCEHLQIPDDEEFRRPPLSYANLHPNPLVSADVNHPRTRFTTACHTISTWLMEKQQELPAVSEPSLP